MDGIFALLDSSLSTTNFLNLLNKQYSNIQFTMEKSIQALTFLNAHVQIQENELDLSVWRKETNIGILLNFNAIRPNIWKSSHLLRLLKSICSDKHPCKVEIGKLKHLFYNNIYPIWFLDIIYNKFKAKLNGIPVDEINIVNNVELCPSFIPYVGEVSICFAKALSRSCLKQLNARLILLYCINKVDSVFNKNQLRVCLGAQMFTDLLVRVIRT